MVGTLLVGGEQQLEGRMGWDRITRKDGTMKIKQCGTGGTFSPLATQHSTPSIAGEDKYSKCSPCGSKLANVDWNRVKTVDFWAQRVINFLKQILYINKTFVTLLTFISQSETVRKFFHIRRALIFP